MDSHTTSKSVKYHWALNEKGETVSIKDINEQNRGKNYYCPNCGCPMIPSSITKENKRQPHFKHKGGEHCSYESYLHKLAKKRLKEIFDNREHFYVEVDAVNCCDQFNTCKLRASNDTIDSSAYIKKVDCPTHYKKVLDLKKFYDKCELESGYNNFIADVMLSDSKGENPVPLFLEIYHTHECEQVKIDSGIPIIEFVVKTEEDLELLEINVIKELSVHAGNRKKENKKIVFYNLNKFEDSKPYENNPIRHRVDATIFLIEEQSIKEKPDRVICHDLFTGENFSPETVSSICITNRRLLDNSLENEYTKRCWLALNKILRLCCEQCRHCKRQVSGNGWNRRLSVSCVKNVSFPIKTKTWTGQIVESSESLSRYCHFYGYDRIFSMSCQLFELDKERLQSVIERGGCVGWSSSSYKDQD